MDEYIVIENYRENKKDSNKSKYSIICLNNQIKVLDIADHFRDSLGIANGIVKLLNTNKIKLNLEI